jgi:putative ABC transport system ATP-binding protein
MSLSASPSSPSRAPRIVPVEGTALLAGRALYKDFGQTAALRGIDFELAAGEIVAIMGPSGSGKSTLLHCLAGIALPNRGEVTFEGRSMAAMSDAERSRLRRSAFGFVFQFGQLIPELSAIENIALPLLLNGLRRADAEQLAATWFARLDLAGLEHRRAGEMSGGQAQRIAIARALVIEPAIVFADEPTGSLDSLAGEHVMELLTGAATEHGAAVVIVTHEPRVAAYAQREVIVRDGRISGAEPA